MAGIVPMQVARLGTQGVCLASGLSQEPWCAGNEGRRATERVHYFSTGTLQFAPPANHTSLSAHRITKKPRTYQCQAAAGSKASSTSKRVSEVLPAVPPWTPRDLNVPLPAFDNPHETVDVVVVGCGPGGLSVAERVGAAGLSVVCIDPAPTSSWRNNYGVWVEEFEKAGLTDCLEVIWPRSNVHLDVGKERFLNRPYGRVDRLKLKRTLLNRAVQHGVRFLRSTVTDIQHSPFQSQLVCADGTKVSALIVVDATGFSCKLLQFSEPFEPGYQAAYGIMAKVDSHPFPLDTMLFMDWRDDHLRFEPSLRAGNMASPSFLYVMPMSPTRVFLEETSLVARPAVPFDVLKERLACRLQKLGVKVLEIEEDEYCLIPMGGALPTLPQRVLGIGGSAGHVHPCTGFCISRTLLMAPVLADALVKEVYAAKAYQQHHVVSQAQAQRPPAAAAAEGRAEASGATVGPAGPPNAFAAARVSARAWDAVWDQRALQQREYYLFGMSVLIKLDLAGIREFFSGFFRLSDYHWMGFLSYQLSLQELITFSLTFFARGSNAARESLVLKGFPGLLTMAGNIWKMDPSKK
eukprot:jgi/Mesvir1/3181/Mv16339-RA.1